MRSRRGNCLTACLERIDVSEYCISLKCLNHAMDPLNSSADDLAFYCGMPTNATRHNNEEPYLEKGRDQCCLIQFRFVVNVSAVFCCLTTSGRSSSHVTLRHALIFTYSSPLVPSKSISCQVSILGIETLFSSLCLLDVGLLMI